MRKNDLRDSRYAVGVEEREAVTRISGNKAKSCVLQHGDHRPVVDHLISDNVRFEVNQRPSDLHDLSNPQSLALLYSSPVFIFILWSLPK